MFIAAPAFVAWIGAIGLPSYLVIFSKSDAGCLQIGQMKPSGNSSPMYSYPQIVHRHTVCPAALVCGLGLTLA